MRSYFRVPNRGEGPARRTDLAVGVVAPARERPSGHKAAGGETARAELGEGPARRVGLPVLVIAPAGDGVRPTMVMVSSVGLALKDHGRARTLKGLRAGDAGGLAAHRPAMLTLQGPCPAMVL